jgi:hypothetical protein
MTEFKSVLSIFYKITHVSTVVVGSRCTVTGFIFGESARPSSARWQEYLAASACELGSRLGFHRDVKFWLFLSGFYLRDLLPIPMGLASADAGVVLTWSFWIVLSCIIIYYYFVYSAWFIYLSYFSFSYAHLVVHTLRSCRSWNPNLPRAPEGLSWPLWSPPEGRNKYTWRARDRQEANPTQP